MKSAELWVSRLPLRQRFALCADEMIFQNALMHGPAALRDSVVNKTFRKLTWNGGSHPKVYTSADLDMLLASDAWHRGAWKNREPRRWAKLFE